MIVRPRRIRQNKLIRDLVSEVSIRTKDLIQPIFVKEGENIKNPIASMPGFYQLSIDNLDKEILELTKLGIKSVLLFGIPDGKDETGSHSLKNSSIIAQATKYIKERFPDILVIADVCLCEYTSHGHCGKLNKAKNDVDNDSSIKLLAEQSVAYAKAGVDIVAPSANMDGMVGAIRQALDANCFTSIPIMSYAVKYASSMYGPFREAAEGAPQFGDRSTYQMNYSNRYEALKEAQLDIEEGADFLMVKPAHTYLDIIREVKNNFPETPLAAYHTSGEYAMIIAAAEKGMIDKNKAILEVTTSIKRAGADIIITYFAKHLAAIIGK